MRNGKYVYDIDSLDGHWKNSQQVPKAVIFILSFELDVPSICLKYCEVICTTLFFELVY